MYAGRKLKESTWSCSLVTSKSEFLGITLGTELIYLVAKSMGAKVEDVMFATESTIAFSWCCNPT